MVISKVGKRIPRPVVFMSTIVGIAGGALLIKEAVGGARYQGIDTSTAEGKIVIVTGANTGIGKETAWELARRNAKVYMACRDLKRCEEAREEIVISSKNKYVYCRKCDLGSIESIKEFVKTFKEQEKHLDVLINNAGVMQTSNKKTKDGFEMQLGVNHLGHFLLTNLLVDVLKESAPSRIVNLTSSAYKIATINKSDLNYDSNFDSYRAYAQSKLANVLFTMELAKRLQGTGVTVNCINPGTADTEITRHMSFSNSWLAKIFIKPLSWPFIKSPRQAAQPVLYLALDDSVANVSGQYYSDYEKTPVTTEAKNESTAKWLWAVSEKWTRLNEIRI